jgi:glyoxylase-like metal-dependent hydrolase (beta-lactamase superfamily II)
MIPRTVVSLSFLIALAGCTRTEAPAVPDETRLSKLSDPVYTLRGNGACDASAGFVVTGKGVVVVDPGASRKAGEWLVTKIASVTTEPVVAIFNTHRHAEQWLGNQALKTTWPKAVIYAHAQTVAAAKREGETWLGRLGRAAADPGSAVVAAEIPVEDGDTLRVGPLHFRVHALAPAHTDSDIALEVVEAGAVFAGDAVFAGCLGSLDEASIAGSINATTKLLALEARSWVPGHGAGGGREVVQAWHDYLATVSTQVRALRDQGRTESELRPAVLERLGRWRQWQEFEVQAPRHIAIAFRETGAN